jgi:hypothetical protein
MGSPAQQQAVPSLQPALDLLSEGRRAHHAAAGTGPSQEDHSQSVRDIVIAGLCGETDTNGPIEAATASLVEQRGHIDVDAACHNQTRTQRLEQARNTTLTDLLRNRVIVQSSLVFGNENIPSRYTLVMRDSDGQVSSRDPLSLSK